MTFVIAGGNDNHCSVTYGDRDDPQSTAEVMGLYGVLLLMQETSVDEVTDLNGDLPTDTHVVTYSTPEGAVGCDAVRAYKKTDIFDFYCDARLKVISIESGFGTIKPKLFVDKRKDS